MKEYKNLEFDGGNNKILAMHDERSPYFYLPGGRVQMGETAEHAVVRGVEEEDYIIKSPMKRISSLGCLHKQFYFANALSTPLIKCKKTPF